MSKFKVGDRVKVLSTKSSNIQASVGRTGTVEDHTISNWEGLNNWVIVDGDPVDPGCYSRKHWYYADDELELVRDFKKGDKVRVTRATVSRFGADITAGTTGVVKQVNWDGDFILVDDLGGVFGDKGIKESDLELVTVEPEPEPETIEEGDTVKATHAASDSVVQGVAAYVSTWGGDVSNVEITNPVTDGTLADLYASAGWEFEVVAKKKSQPKVGDVVKDAASLPVGTVTREQDFSGTYFRTTGGWVSLDGGVFRGADYVNDTIIAYLPPTDSE